MSSNFKRLINEVILNSEANNRENAVSEWELIDTNEDENCNSTCICGKTGIRYLHRIKNILNKNQMYPIGSCCIKKFKRSDLNEIIDIKEKLFKLYHAVENKEFIELNTELFSRKLIYYLYKQGAFKSNNPLYNEIDNYEFFLDMFNSRDKDPRSPKMKKIRAIMINNIIPFVRERIKNKII